MDRHKPRDYLKTWSPSICVLVQARQTVSDAAAKAPIQTDTVGNREVGGELVKTEKQPPLVRWLIGRFGSLEIQRSLILGANHHRSTGENRMDNRGLPRCHGLLESICALNPKKIVLSTPDRDLLFNHNGPPKNPAHVREWSYKEFRQYISQYFEIEDHFISNKNQCTQVIICKPKDI